MVTQQQRPALCRLFYGVHFAFVAMAFIRVAMGAPELEAPPTTAPAESVAAPAAPSIAPESSVLTIDYSRDEGTGSLLLSDSPVPITGMTLRAQPLRNGDNTAFIYFPKNNDEKVSDLQLDAACPDFPGTKPCLIAYGVRGVRGTGTYQGPIDIYSTHEKVGSIAIAAIRPDPVFRPTLSGDVVKDGQIQFDATLHSWFYLTIENPTGSPWRTFNLEDCSEITPTACVPPVSKDKSDPSAFPITYVPRSLTLGPGQSGRVIATIRRVPNTPHFLRISDAQENSLSAATPVSITTLTPRLWKLFLAVLAGTVLSVLLNSIFPFSRSKAEVLASLRRVSETLAACGSLCAAARDALASEISRNRLILERMSFLGVGKDSVIEDARQATAKLSPLADLARNVSNLRARLDNGELSVRSRLASEARLRAAEESLIAFDATRAAMKVEEATQIQKENDCKELSQKLRGDIEKVLRERGNEAVRLYRSKQEPSPETVPVNSGAGANAEPANVSDVSLERRRKIRASEDAIVKAGRNRDIARLMSKLEINVPFDSDITDSDLLELERDLYIADVWTEYAEPLKVDDADHFSDCADKLLQLLKSNPSSREAQLLLALFRASVTPTDIDKTLEAGKARIECNPYPRSFELIDCGFVFTDPVIAAVPAARQFVSYQWDFSDGTNPQGNFERCKHYFVRRWWERLARRRQPYVRTITVLVSIANHQVRRFSKQVTVQRRAAFSSHERWMQGVTLVVSTGIAMITAFSAQYSAAIPDVLTWQSYLTAFMLGFGLDQIRDKTTGAAAKPATSAENVPQQTKAAPASVPEASLAPSK